MNETRNFAKKWIPDWFHELNIRKCTSTPALACHHNYTWYSVEMIIWCWDFRILYTFTVKWDGAVSASGFKVPMIPLWSCGGWCVGSTLTGTQTEILSLFLPASVFPLSLWALFHSLSFSSSLQSASSFLLLVPCFLSFQHFYLVCGAQQKPTHKTGKQPIFNDWPVLVVCHPLSRCFLCCFWTLPSAGKRQKDTFYGKNVNILE